MTHNCKENIMEFPLSGTCKIANVYFKNGTWYLKVCNNSIPIFHCPFCGEKLESNNTEDNTYWKELQKNQP